MSRNPGGDNNEDEDERFYDSLDRIASSNSCSGSNLASAFDSESDPIPCSEPPISYGNPFPVPKFPKVVSKFDIWISEPASVSERRTRLLSEMGLSRDPVLSRSRPGSDFDEMGLGGGDFGKSVSSDRLTCQELGQNQGSDVIRSKSDGADVRSNGGISAECGGGTAAEEEAEKTRFGRGRGKGQRRKKVSN